jgi:regulator of protease activity HflC (stomatin/prohibitin superfamily)
LKEQALDVDPQTCITRDNISVEVDGILYLQVIDPKKASYGINNYQFASSQLAQTTMRSVIGKLELDRTFEERETINHAIVAAVDKASDPWGVKVTRYEVKNIVPPKSIKDAMEKQMRAEREKRAVIAESEGEKQKMINEAEGQAAEIMKVAEATAQGIQMVASASQEKGGMEAINLRVAENYLTQFGKLAKTNNTLIIPSNLADVSGIIASAMKVIEATKDKGGGEVTFTADK